MTAEITELHPTAQDDLVTRVNGVYDILSPDRVSGWAIDRSDEKAVVTVQVLREGVLVGTAPADRYRKDLERGGIGSGNYGYSVELDPPLAPGMGFTITVQAVTDDGVSGPLRPAGSARPSEDPEIRLLQQTFARIVEISRQIEQEAGHRLPPSPVESDRLEAAIDRIEVVQARLELTLAETERSLVTDADKGLRISVALSLLTGLVALSIGLYSIFNV